MKVKLKIPTHGMYVGDQLIEVGGFWKLGEVKLSEEVIRSKPEAFDVTEDEQTFDGYQDLLNQSGMQDLFPRMKNEVN